jgi:tetratricopeptide (TPR) repeat protein
VSLLERKSDQCFSIHRVIQEAFRYWCDKDQALQHFTAAVHIVHQVFPRQVNGRPMHDSWAQCQSFIQHGQILATRFHELRKRFPGEIEPPPELLELLKSCGWYLFEMADHPATIALLDTALETVPDKALNTEICAHLRNTIACCTFELSDLARCRRELDKALTIREAWAKKKAPGAEEELANTLNNYGNLESAEGKYESALSYFSKARMIRLKLGKNAIVPLGVTYMTTGRALFLLGKHEEAIAEYKNAEKIFLDMFGSDAHFMAQ